MVVLLRGECAVGVTHTANTSGTHTFGRLTLTSGQIAGQITAHAMVGGVAASLQGGKFGHGFFAAGFAKGLGTHLNDHYGHDIVAGTATSAVVGGTASVIAGGKFANGAVTAAFQALYNHYSQLKEAAALSKQRDRMLMDVRSLDLTTDHDRNILAFYAGMFDVNATETDLWGSHRDANYIRRLVEINIITYHAQGMVPVIGKMAVNQYGGYARDAVLHVNPWTRAFVVPFCFVSDMLGGKICG